MIDTKKLVKNSHIIILGTPHSFYKIKIPKNKFLIDSWGFCLIILLLGGSGNLGSAIIQSNKFKNIFILKNIVNILNKKKLSISN